MFRLGVVSLELGSATGARSRRPAALPVKSLEAVEAYLEAILAALQLLAKCIFKMMTYPTALPETSIYFRLDP